MVNPPSDVPSNNTAGARPASSIEWRQRGEFAARLAAIEMETIELAERRLALLDAWKSAFERGETPHPPPFLWEQLEPATSLREAIESRGTLPWPRALELLRGVAGSVHFSRQAAMPVAYLGPIYSYSYLAAVTYFSGSAQLSPVATIAAVFEEIVRRQAEYGVVPIENSTDGRIVDTLTMFAKVPVRICGEILLPIHHCLLGRCRREEIREVYSKPQALSQCRHWLSQHLPEAKLFEISSTTAAAKLAAEKPGVAAIASMEAGIHYGLNVIQENIEDNPDNLTRFAVLGHSQPARTGYDKTSIMFQIPHRSGALANAMQSFSDGKLNMTWIESFPIPGNSNEYLFFIEFEGHQSEPAVAATLEQLKQQTLRLEVLGSYPRGKPPTR